MCVHMKSKITLFQLQTNLLGLAQALNKIAIIFANSNTFVIVFLWLVCGAAAEQNSPRCGRHSDAEHRRERQEATGGG